MPGSKASHLQRQPWLPGVLSAQCSSYIPCVPSSSLGHRRGESSTSVGSHSELWPGCPLSCLTSAASRGGWTAQGVGKRAGLGHHLEMASKMWKRHWPHSWCSANSTKCHLLFLFLACFPENLQEAAHVMLSGFPEWGWGPEYRSGLGGAEAALPGSPEPLPCRRAACRGVWWGGGCPRGDGPGPPG